MTSFLFIMNQCNSDENPALKKLLGEYLKLLEVILIFTKIIVLILDFSNV